MKNKYSKFGDERTLALLALKHLKNNKLPLSVITTTLRVLDNPTKDFGMFLLTAVALKQCERTCFCVLKDFRDGTLQNTDQMKPTIHMIRQLVH